jgi:hypothetical protein
MTRDAQAGTTCVADTNLSWRPEIIDRRQRGSPLGRCKAETLPLRRHLPEHFCPSAPGRALAGFDGTPTEGKFGPT